MVVAARGDSKSNPHLAGLGGRLTVEITNLVELLEQMREVNKDPRKTFVPFLDGIALGGVYPEALDLQHGTMRFHLRRTDKSREAWAALLGSPCRFHKDVAVSVGPEDGQPLPSNVDGGNSLHLIVIREVWFWGFTAACVLLLGWFIASAHKTSMLRDSGPEPGQGKLRPFSLAKSQMAFWFVLTVVSYLFLFAVTGAYDSVPTSVFVLIGISAATGLGVLMQDSSKDPVARKHAAKTDHAALAALPVRTLDQEKRFNELELQLAEPLPPVPSSQGFFRDILTDARGASFHRFQMATWTAVMGLVFLVEVFRNLAMPEFDGTLLALMGVSSGTYLGFMIPEPHSSEQS